MRLRQVGETYGVGMSPESRSEALVIVLRGERTLRLSMRNEEVVVKN